MQKIPKIMIALKAVLTMSPAVHFFGLFMGRERSQFVNIICHSRSQDCPSPAATTAIIPVSQSSIIVSDRAVSPKIHPRQHKNSSFPFGNPLFVR